MISADPGLVQYMNGVLPQMSGGLPGCVTPLVAVSSHSSSRLRSADWLEQGELQRLVLVITSQSTKEVLERWTFNIQTEQAAVAGKYAA